MANPLIIPNIPGGWCSSWEKTVTYIDLLNINFEIIVNAYNETFTDELVLPGIPPVTGVVPGFRVPGISAQQAKWEARMNARESAYTGNRFPWRITPATKSAPFTRRGFPGFDIPPYNINIGSRDAMTIIMEYVRVNYEIILKALESHSLVPIIDWSQTFRDCNNPPDLNPNNTNINDAIGNPIDGPPFCDPDTEICSAIPTFGPRSGGAASCWTITGGDLVQLEDGTWAVAYDGVSENFVVELNCSCTVTGTGPITWGITAIGGADPGGELCLAGNIKRCSDGANRHQRGGFAGNDQTFTYRDFNYDPLDPVEDLHPSFSPVIANSGTHWQITAPYWQAGTTETASGNFAGGCGAFHSDFGNVFQFI